MSDQPQHSEEVLQVVQDLSDAIGEYAGICCRLDSKPMYGRDARNVGVADGTCFAPSEYDLESARNKANDAVTQAISLGLLDKPPFWL